MNFCPQCGTALVRRLDGGRHRPACPGEGCGYTHYGDASIGTGAVVVRDGRVLLIQRRTPTREFWQIPGGYVEVDEAIDAAVEREVLEETGVVARVTECLGFRHAAGLQGERPAANLYVVFRLEAAEGEPRPDGEESFAAAYFSPDEMATLPNLTTTSIWAIEQAAATEGRRGLLRAPAREGLQRLGHTLFGAAAT